MPQHTPLDVTSAPPLAVMLPPVLAELIVISEGSVVVIVANTGSFLHPVNKMTSEIQMVTRNKV